MTAENEARDGVAEAFGDWLDLHDVTVPDALLVGAREAVSAWLDAHEGQIVEAIAQAVARNHSLNRE